MFYPWVSAYTYKLNCNCGCMVPIRMFSMNRFSLQVIFRTSTWGRELGLNGIWGKLVTLEKKTFYTILILYDGSLYYNVMYLERWVPTFRELFCIHCRVIRQPNWESDRLFRNGRKKRPIEGTVANHNIKEREEKHKARMDQWNRRPLTR
jgi:hypothetical protein